MNDIKNINSNTTLELYLCEYDATVAVLLEEIVASLRRQNDEKAAVYEYYGISTDRQIIVEIPEVEIIRAYIRQVYGINDTDKQIDKFILAVNQNSNICDLIEQGRSIFDGTDFIICSGDMNNGIFYKYRHIA